MCFDVFRKSPTFFDKIRFEKMRILKWVQLPKNEDFPRCRWEESLIFCHFSFLGVQI